MTVTVEGGAPAKPGWAKKGAAAQTAMKNADAADQARQAEMGKLRRFYLPNEKQTTITFLDGSLDADGIMDNLVYYEHNLNLNGHWRNWFVCTVDSEPCPLCESGDSKAALVGAFTVIDHSEWTDNKGNLHKDERRLFIAKRGTLKQLQMIATKRGGLEGCTFDVMRTGDKSPAVGNVFDFTSKTTLAALAGVFPEAAKGAADYGKEITYKDAAQLRAEGFGTAVIGAETGGAMGNTADYNGQL